MMVDCWNRFFDVAEEMNIDFCLYISPFQSATSTARQPHAAALPLKYFFLWSTPWTSVGSASLSLSLAKGRAIKDDTPNPKVHPNSTTSTEAKQSTKAIHKNNKPPTSNHTRNFKDKNGDEVQVYSQKEKGRQTKNTLEQSTSQIQKSKPTTPILKTTHKHQPTEFQG